MSLRESLSYSFEIYNMSNRLFTTFSSESKSFNWLCNLEKNLLNREQFRRKIQTIEIRKTLCNRREAQRRDRFKIITKQKNSNDAMNDFNENFKKNFTICRLIQCSFCLNNKSLLYHHRVYEYVKSHQMMNEIEKHFWNFVSKNSISCLQSQCKTIKFVLRNVMSFKNHTTTMHKIFLRAWTSHSLVLTSLINFITFCV